jgi:mRNA interferase MazF
MTRFETGDIVLVQFPFTDLSAFKKRPAIILSSSTYSEHLGDIVLMPLTSQPEAQAPLAITEWQSAGLVKPTWIKPLIGTLAM